MITNGTTTLKMGEAKHRIYAITNKAYLPEYFHEKVIIIPKRNIEEFS